SPAALGGGIILLGRMDSAATERIYSRGVFPVVSAMVGLPARLAFGLSLAALILLFAALFLLAMAGRMIWQLIRKKGERGSILFRYGRGLTLLLSCVLLAFAITCAPNYERLTFAEQSGLEVRSSSADELAALCAELIEEANQLREQVSVDHNGIMALPDRSFSDAAQRAQSAFNAIEGFDFLGHAALAPKPFLFSEALSYLQLTGFYFPFTAEANLNAHTPPIELPFTMCHELAHTRGFMREDEANFIAALACRASDSPEIRYSGTALSLIHATNALYDADAARYFSLRSGYSAGLDADLAAQSAYWRRYDTPIAEVSDAVNGAYLKANNQSDGLRSYGRMVDLLLADYRARHGL
ncbi:MAG: DUF3810 domain-containing protein, partial [Oscillospiraceae bacterium]